MIGGVRETGRQGDRETWRHREVGHAYDFMVVFVCFMCFCLYSRGACVCLCLFVYMYMSARMPGESALI